MKPTFLYNGPHPVHEKMLDTVDAEFCEASGDIISRLTAKSHNSHPLVIEGGIPLVEGAIAAQGPLIELAADTTHLDIVEQYEFRGRVQRWVHRWYEQYVDATIAVSDEIATVVKSRYDRPVEVVYPFVVKEMQTRLADFEPSLDSDVIVCVGTYCEKNGQDMLVETAEELDHIEFHLIGEGTDAIYPTDNVVPHGYVSSKKLVDILSKASAMVFPARAGAFPVTTLEGMFAGVPVITTPNVGTAGLIRSVDDRFITTNCTETLSWYVNTELNFRENVSREFKSIGRFYTEDRRINDFRRAYNRVIEEIL